MLVQNVFSGNTDDVRAQMYSFYSYFIPLGNFNSVDTTESEKLASTLLSNQLNLFFIIYLLLPVFSDAKDPEEAGKR